MYEHTIAVHVHSYDFIDPSAAVAVYMHAQTHTNR